MRVVAIWDQQREKRDAKPIELAMHIDQPPVRDERISLFDSDESDDPPVIVPEATVSLAEDDDDAVFVTPLEEDASFGREREGGAPGQPCVSCRPVEPDAVYTDSLGALIERDGVQIVFPTPGAIMRWLRERVFNRVIKRIDAKTPRRQDAKTPRRQDAKTPGEGPAKKDDKG